MASRKSSGDMVLGAGHVVGLFALLVIMLGVVFGLGYLLGRSQYDPHLTASVEAARRLEKPAASKPEKSDKPAPAAASAPALSGVASAGKNGTGVDFYHTADGSEPEARLEPPPKAAASRRKTVAAPDPKTLEAGDGALRSGATAAPLVAAATVPAKNRRGLAASAPGNIPPIPKGATVLQVAALVREGDALALAQALQQKRFPAFVLTPGADQFYRVQVGPYGDAKSANAARMALENQGFKSIIKR
jgi:cell division septation protein DedD